ncbi:unnamed protein product [Closterium sp. NIES-54]
MQHNQANSLGNFDFASVAGILPAAAAAAAPMARSTNLLLSSMASTAMKMNTYEFISHISRMNTYEFVSTSTHTSPGGFAARFKRASGEGIHGSTVFWVGILSGIRSSSPPFHYPPRACIISPHLSSPHLTSPHLSSPHLTSPHLSSPLLSSLLSDGAFYDDPDAGGSIRQLLASKYEAERAQGMKRVLALLATGHDASEFFTDVSVIWSAPSLLIIFPGMSSHSLPHALPPMLSLPCSPSHALPPMLSLPCSGGLGPSSAYHYLPHALYNRSALLPTTFPPSLSSSHPPPPPPTPQPSIQGPDGDKHPP